MIFHVVRPGDTLTSIADAYGTTTQLLILNNGMPNPNNLAVGQCVVVAYPKITHTVLPGDTVNGIAVRYGVSSNAIYRNNPQLMSQSLLSVGQNLVISFEDAPLGNFETGGYAYPSIEEALLTESMPFMNRVMPFTYGFNPDATLVNLDDERILSAAISYGARPFMHLSTLTPEGVFSNSLAADFLNNRMMWQRLLDNILNVMNAKGYVGLDIDFEFLPAEDALKYAEFVTLARTTLNPLGYEVMVALAPKTSDNQPGLLYQGHDYAALGEAANFVLLMTYEWGYT